MSHSYAPVCCRLTLIEWISKCDCFFRLVTFIGNVTLRGLTSVFVFLRDSLWVGEAMSYFINIQSLAFTAELREMFCLSWRTWVCLWVFAQIYCTCLLVTNPKPMYSLENLDFIQNTVITACPVKISTTKQRLRFGLCQGSTQNLYVI